MLASDAISKIALDFVTNEDFDTQLNKALAIVGEELGVSRAYLFLDSADGSTTSNTHEWCAAGVEPQIATLQNISYAALPSWKEVIANEKVLAVDDVGRLPIDMRSVLEPQGIRSIILAPLRVDGQSIGFIGFDECARVRTWTAREIVILETILGIVGNSYGKHRLAVQLALTEENFRSFFEAVDDIIVVADLDGRLVFANEEATRKLGYSPDELCAMRVIDLHPPDKREEASAILASMLRKERTSCPLELATRDGRRIPVETRIWFGQWNGAPGIFGLAKDLSAEQAALQKFEKLFRSNPAPMAVSKIADGRFLDVNSAFLDRLGYRRDEVIGHSSKGLGLFSDDESWTRMREQLARSGSIRNQEFVVRRKDGGCLNGLFSGDVIESQGQKYFLTVMVDVTAQMRLREELRIERQRLINVIEGTRLGTWEWNVQTGETLFNERWAGILGYSLAELAPTNIETWSRLTHPDDLAESARLLDRHFEGGTDYYECEVRMRHRNGSWVWVLDRGKIIERDGQGHPLKMYGTHTDITPLKETEAALRAAKDAADSSNTAKSRFLANMSHEIRTPMNAILGYAHLLKHSPMLPEQTDRLDKIEDAGRHLLAIINDILDISKIEAGKLILEQTSFDLAAIMDHVQTLIAEGAKAKRLAITVDYDSVPAMLLGDPTRLRQGLLNLASNAVKFTDKGGISLRGKLVERRGLELLVRFEVQDTGVGIPPERCKDLFQAFQQIDASTTRKYGGTGLGLAITQRLAQLMGGEAGVESELGVGSTFWFTAWLRLGSAPARETTVTYSAPEEELRIRHAGARILLVEDEPINQEVALELLGDTGLRVDVADSGRQAVDKAARIAYAAILMDVQMPEIDGLEATAMIRAMPERSRTPIIAMTANAFDEDKQRCINAGMSDFMAKPVNPEILYQTLLRWLSQRGH